MSSPAEEEKDDVTKAALTHDDGFFDPLVFNRSFFDPLADKQQSSSPTESTTTDQMDLINLTTPLTKGQAEQHAKEAYLNTIDKRVTSGSTDDTSQPESPNPFASIHSSSPVHSSSNNNNSFNTHYTKIRRVTISTSGSMKRRCNSFIANVFDLDEEGCCFCPCLNDDDDDEDEQHHNKQSTPYTNSSLQQCIQSCQSILYQHPLFYRLSLRLQQNFFPRARRRASDPMMERPVTISTTRLFFMRIHYKSLMMGMVLALIIVRFGGGGVGMKNDDDSMYGSRLEPMGDGDDGGFQHGGGDWQQHSQQSLEPLVYYHDDKKGETPWEGQREEESGKDLIDWSIDYLRGSTLQRDGADPADLATDSSIMNSTVIEEAELSQVQQRGEDQHRNSNEAARVDQERINSEEEAVQHQQQFNAELARQQQQPQEQPSQPQPNTVELNNLKNTWDPHEPNDIAIMWHVRASGSSVIRHAVGGCHRLVQASGFGSRDGHDVDDQVGVIYPSEGSPFVNIDSTTIAGIKHAASMRFADAQVADVVVTPLIYETNELFTQKSKGRFFAVFSHPVDRAVRLFYTMQEVQPALREWTLERYARSTYVENNFVTRQLSNQLQGPLDESHYRKAVEIIRDKFLVGLASQIDQSLDRYEKYFRWTYRIQPKSQEACRKRILLEESAAEKKMKRRMPKEGDPIWAWLLHHNAFDLRLYAYVERLFEEQAVFVKGARENFRNIDTTCCRCEPATFPAFDLDGNDDDEISPGDNMEQQDGDKEGTQKSTFEGGIRLLRRLPPALISALFVPCTVDDFWLND
ncbi:hypothetical protein QTG54_008475 [Skeletonema marinoi]|uniref:Uncharacterized protein n=1 Tax=Skeletonema marinoi TaxID=267567 RepID=A0AAD9DCZ4_9STRA|nr:hypothetical protein QTG54_008475 [Skeletonema marinoi]